MKKELDQSVFAFHYGNGVEIPAELFASFLADPRILDYPRPLLFGIRIHGGNAPKKGKEKLIGLIIQQFGTCVYSFVGNLAYAYTPNGVNKAENIVKLKRIISNFGDLDLKTALSASATLAYPDKDNIESILNKLDPGEEEGIVVYDDQTIDKENPSYLSKSELADLAASLASDLGFHSTGLALIRPELNLVETLEETGRPSFSLLGKTYSLERVLPFATLAHDDSYFYIADSRNLPSKPMAILDSIGVVSMIIRFFYEGNTLLGFAYACSRRNLGYFGLKEAKVIEDYFALMNKRFLLIRDELHQAEKEKIIADVTSNADNGLVRVNLKGNLTYVSPNLKKAYPDARINDKAFKAWPSIFNDKEIVSGTEVSLSELGSGTYRIHYLGQDENGVRSYLFTRLNEVIGSKKREKGSRLFSRESFDELLQEELLAFKKGTLLFVRLSNSEMVASKSKTGKEEEVVNGFASYLIGKGYGYDLYRFDNNTFVYFFPGKEKEDGKSLALALANKLAKPIKTGKYTYKPEVDYLLTSYPIEVASLPDADSFVRALMGQADEFGHGRLIELNKERGRLLLTSAYEEEAVKKAVVAQEVPFRLTPVKDITTNKIAYIHLDLDIRGEDGDEILPPKIYSASERVKLAPKLYSLAQEKLSLSYLEDMKTLKGLGYKGVLFHVPMSLMAQDNFYNNFLKAVVSNREFLYLRFGANELKDEKAINRLNALRNEGFKLLLEDYERPFDYDFDGYATQLWNLTSGATEKGVSFLQVCQKHARANKLVAVGFVDDPAAVNFLNSSHLAYAMGLAAGKALNEKDLMTTIRNKRKAK